MHRNKPNKEEDSIRPVGFLRIGTQTCSAVQIASDCLLLELTRKPNQSSTKQGKEPRRNNQVHLVVVPIPHFSNEIAWREWGDPAMKKAIAEVVVWEVVRRTPC